MFSLICIWLTELLSERGKCLQCNPEWWSTTYKKSTRILKKHHEHRAVLAYVAPSLKWSLNHPTKQSHCSIYTVFFFLILSKISGWENFSFISWHSKQKLLWEKEVCPKQQGQSDGSTEAAPRGAGWRQHSRAGAQGPVPGAAPGQGQGLVLLSSQVSDPPCLQRAFPGEVSMISSFQTFLSYKKNHTLNQAEEFLSPHPTEGPIYWAPKIIFSPPLARYIFYKTVAKIAIRVLKHMGAPPSFTVFLLSRKSIYEMKETEYMSQITMQLETLIKYLFN